MPLLSVGFTRVYAHGAERHETRTRTSPATPGMSYGYGIAAFIAPYRAPSTNAAAKMAVNNIMSSVVLFVKGISH